MKKMIREWLDARHAARAERKRARLVRMAAEAVQVQEFGGKIYLALNGRPVINVDCLSAESLAEVLGEVRATYVDFSLYEAGE